jgi:hypothetical protein
MDWAGRSLRQNKPGHARRRVEKEEEGRRGIAFYGYLSAVLSLLIVTAAAIWSIYTYLPGIYYLPLSLGVLVLVGVVAYVILSRRILT